ncbi:tyrosine kinase receptor Cad96Ca-like isoform X2 [Paramacrobiotus metropolitanus]|uniref:tyrosine kinase receptor Cad96Ca-like isoform X2 n=1 Tax=Paramacrobiotus metropolitanus TaxID=2943436 RepID=UPI002445C060|nr:tyrosine kinase receptor Cad96Ca-like isoform X2 [Paramacrobiotus metropolitanus]
MARTSVLSLFTAFLLIQAGPPTPPMLTLLHNMREWNLPVSTPVGAKVSQLLVNGNKDDTSVRDVVFNISADNPEYSDFFNVDAKSGIVTLKKPLDIQNYRDFVVVPTVDNGYMKAKIQVPVHVLSDDNSTEIRSTVNDMSFASLPSPLGPFPPRTISRPRVTTPEVVVFTPGPDVLVTDRPSQSARPRTKPKTTSTTSAESGDPTIAGVVPGVKHDGEERKEKGDAGEHRKDVQDGEPMNNRNNLQLLWILLPGALLFLAVAGFVCYRMRRAPMKEKMPIAKSMSVETGQSLYKDAPSGKDFGTLTKEPLKMMVSNHRYLYRKRSENFAASTIQTGPDGYLKPDVAENWEFPRDKVQILEKVGEGCFGQVFKAEALEPSGCIAVVAVKTLKDNASDKERRDLLAELHVMQSLQPHTNVVELLGCCTDKDPTYVIMEFVAFGKLQSFLRRSRNSHYYGNVAGAGDGHNLTGGLMLKFAYQVACGMHHISSQYLVHRDLAARNILLTEDLVCKVSDFGLARDISDKHIYERKSEGRLPIRWMAPESIADNVFSSQSDVWSFGVLLWEIVTLGATPYPGMSAGDVVAKVRDGFRMENPTPRSQELYEHIMLPCWQLQPKDRLSFSAIADALGRMLQETQDYLDLNEIPHYYNIFTDLSGEKV